MVDNDSDINANNGTINARQITCHMWLYWIFRMNKLSFRLTLIDGLKVNFPMFYTYLYSQEVVAPRRLVVRSAPCLDQTMSLMRCMRCGGLSVTLMIVILWIQGQSDDSW